MVPVRVGDTLNQAWKNDKTKFGLKMLQKMGWSEGKGLGKNEDGVSEHVKVAKKSNNLGLGATHDSSGAAGWASTAVSFNGVLETLGKAYGTGRKKAGRRKGAKTNKGSRKKGRADSASDEDDSSSGGEGGASSSAGAQSASACPSRARRVRSKDVKNFSSADLRAILGQAATMDPSLPSYPVIGAAASASPPTTTAAERSRSRPSSSKKKKNRSRQDRDGEGEARSDGDAESSSSPRRRPRTRSMDLAEASEARPRTRSMDRAEGEAGAEVGAGIVALESASSRDKRKNNKKGKRQKKKLFESGGPEESAAARSERKRRDKKASKEGQSKTKKAKS